MNREQKINELYFEDYRVQYDEQDPERLERLGREVTETSVAFLEALGKYRDQLVKPIDEDAPADMKEARIDLIDAWTKLQASASAAALTIRLDGEEAFDRFVTHLSNDVAFDLSGL